jgi:glyoxylase-like metal-dependent hydrolase (beta-lactamase superfamily II)
VAGDLILNGYEPYADTSRGGSLLQFHQTLNRVMALEFERVLPGHGAVMTRAQALRFRDYLAEVERRVRKARSEGKSEDQTEESVTMEDFPEIGPMTPLTSREGTLRAMYRELAEADKKVAP